MRATGPPPDYVEVLNTNYKQKAHRKVKAPKTGPLLGGKTLATGMPLRDEARCIARNKNCRNCLYRYSAAEHDIWYCPSCGEPRRCNRAKVTGVNVCPVHGGGARTKGRSTGRVSNISMIRRMALPKRMLESYDAALEDRELLILRHAIAMVEARRIDLTKRADSGESGRLWKELKSTMEAMKQAENAGEDGTAKALFLKIQDLILEGGQDYDAWDEINDCLDRQKRLVESERKRLMDMHQMISVERVIALMTRVAESITKNVKDAEEVQAVGKDIKALLEDNSADAIINITPVAELPVRMPSRRELERQHGRRIGREEGS